IDACPPLDILVSPGGWGTRTEVHKQRLIDWIGERGRSVETLTSVCTGSMLLGQAKLLDGRRATTHWRSLSRMRDAFPAVTVEEKLHVVEDGHVVTSAGISAGIGMALPIVIRSFGEAVGRAAPRDPGYRRPRPRATWSIRSRTTTRGGCRTAPHPALSPFWGRGNFASLSPLGRGQG